MPCKTRSSHNYCYNHSSCGDNGIVRRVIVYVGAGYPLTRVPSAPALVWRESPRLGPTCERIVGQSRGMTTLILCPGPKKASPLPRPEPPFPIHPNPAEGSL